MLVLSRRLNQAIIVRTATGEKIRVEVVDINRGKIRLGVDTRPETAVHREEIDKVIHPDDYERG